MGGAGGLPTPNVGSFSGSPFPIFFGDIGITMSGSPFTMPTGASLLTFNVTLPALFSGTFDACPMLDASQVGANAGCFGPQGLAPNIASFAFNGRGFANLSFTNLGPQGWRFTQGTYTLSSVPEPSSIMLLGTGAIALVGKFLRRRS